MSLETYTTQSNCDSTGLKLSFTPTALTVLQKRYLKKNSDGEVIEKPYDMFVRIAKALSKADERFGATPDQIAQTEQEFLEMMLNMHFLSGMSLRNAGRKLGQMSACYVLPIEDSMNSIYETLKNAAFLHKTGTGIGYDFSQLRPRNDMVGTTGGKSSGPVSFMKLFDFSCDTIVNNAATRRAGNMGILRVDHPDIEEFIRAKEDNTQLNNFNLSIAITDEFIAAVKAKTQFPLRNPRSGETMKMIDANAFFDQICNKVWASAEPGIIFIDEINRCNPTPHVGEMRSTNQCGEQPLLAYESCNLGSINLAKVLRQNGNSYEIDWDLLADLTRKAVHFLDNVVEINNYLLDKSREINLANRKIGLGIMGFADMLILLGVPYNSDQAIKVGEEVMKFIQDNARQHSVLLGEQRGSFPNFAGSMWENKGYATMRNATCTTIAPTGTTSMIANCSSGVEPIFALAYIRKNILDIGKDEFLEVHPLFEQVAKDRWFYSRTIMDQVARLGSIQTIEGIPQDVKDVFIVSHDVSPECHVKMQAVFQKYTDNAVSKTVNLPHSATVDDVKNIYMLAHETGCKGITIYRDGSRDEQVLNLKK